MANYLRWYPLMRRLPFAWLRALGYRLADNRRTYHISLRLTPPQAEAVEHMLAEWNRLAGMGASRYVAFMADGDGNFKPRARFRGHRARFSAYAPKRGFWHGDECRIDFDTIAWSMRDA